MISETVSNFFRCDKAVFDVYGGEINYFVKKMCLVLVVLILLISLRMNVARPC